MGIDVSSSVTFAGSTPKVPKRRIVILPLKTARTKELARKLFPSDSVALETSGKQKAKKSTLRDKVDTVTVPSASTGKTRRRTGASYAEEGSTYSEGLTNKHDDFLEGFKALDELSKNRKRKTNKQDGDTSAQVGSVSNPKATTPGRDSVNPQSRGTSARAVTPQGSPQSRLSASPNGRPIKRRRQLSLSRTHREASLPAPSSVIPGQIVSSPARNQRQGSLPLASAFNGKQAVTFPAQTKSQNAPPSIPAGSGSPKRISNAAPETYQTPLATSVAPVAQERNPHQETTEALGSLRGSVSSSRTQTVTVNPSSQTDLAQQESPTQDLGFPVSALRANSTSSTSCVTAPAPSSTAAVQVPASTSQRQSSSSHPGTPALSTSQH